MFASDARQALHQWVWARCESSHAAGPRVFRSQALRNWCVAPPRRSVKCTECSPTNFFFFHLMQI